MLNRFLSAVAGLTLCCAVAVAQTSADKPAKCATGEKASASSCEKSCGSSKATASCGDKSKAACGGKALAGMPVMTYRVGDKECCCPKGAAQMAKTDKAEIKYVVAGKAFDDQGEAMTAYADALDKYMGQMMTVKYAVGDDCVACPMEAAELAKKSDGKIKYRLASMTFDSKEQAEKAAKAAREAADKVTMKALVDGKEVDCSKAKACSDKNEKVEYAIGDTKTCCDKQAKVELAKAKIQAALAAIENATKVAGA